MSTADDTLNDAKVLLDICARAHAAGQYAYAIRLAWSAADKVSELAEALEAERVAKDRERRAEKA